MDKARWDQRFRRPVLLITYAIVLFLVGWNFEKALEQIRAFLSICLPIQVGLILAFLVNLPLRMWEKILPDKKSRKFWTRIHRPLCLTLAYITFLAFISLLFFLLIPELRENFKLLSTNFPNYVRSVDNWIDALVLRFGLENSLLQGVDDYVQQLITFLVEWVTTNTSQLFTITKSITSVLYAVFLGVVISVFVLLFKEKIFKYLKRLCQAVFLDATASRLVEIGSLACRTFNQYLAGQFIESLILGTLCFIGMNLFGIPYAPLISVVVCICNMVPVVGSLLGTIPCALLIFMINPMTAVWFVVFIVVLQQLENNLIYPHVVGDTIGIPGLLVILAVLLFGGLFGILGVFLGVPSMAVIYRLVTDAVNRKLEAKKELCKAQAASCPPSIPDDPDVPAGPPQA